MGPNREKLRRSNSVRKIELISFDRITNNLSHIFGVNPDHRLRLISNGDINLLRKDLSDSSITILLLFVVEQAQVSS